MPRGRSHSPHGLDDIHDVGLHADVVRKAKKEKRVAYVHIATGKLYFLIGPAFNKSDGHDGERVVVYMSLAGIRYVRNEKEFQLKFTPVPPEDVTVKTR